ncbi:MAG: sulfatase-like hydrolase/transferase [Acidobacteria bacterium]|nr:sulfatase-like hydrolase/transferase [Acidobacteriota bacterium]
MHSTRAKIAWTTVVLALLDVARMPIETIPSVGPLAYLATEALKSLALYGLTLAALHLIGRSWPELWGTLVLAAIGIAFVKRATGIAPWILDAEIVAILAVLGGWALTKPIARPIAIAVLVVAIILCVPVVRAATTLAEPLDATRTPGAPDVVLIVVDSLREDARIPSLDALGAIGVRFTAATSASPSSAPSTASILTSRLPGDHGVIGASDVLREGVTTLAEAFRARGYATRAVVRGPVISRSQRLDRGFETWTEEPEPKIEARASRPSFTYLALGDLDQSFPRGMLEGILRGEITLTPERLTTARARYAENAAHADREIGRLVEELGARIAGGELLFAVTSTHGEEFMEHGSLGHGQTLYHELIDVPLVIAGKGIVPGSVIADPVSLLDVAPTLLDLATHSKEESFRGRSLAAWLTDPRASHGVMTVESEVDAPPGPRASRRGSRSA